MNKKAKPIDKYERQRRAEIATAIKEDAAAIADVRGLLLAREFNAVRRRRIYAGLLGVEYKEGR